VTNILAHEDPHQYLDWLRAHGVALIPGLFAAARDDELLRRGLIYGLGRAICLECHTPARQSVPAQSAA
jgi:hypothetical protein